MKILSLTGVQELVNQIKSWVGTSYVAKNGTDRLMTAAEGTKLSGIEAGAEVNIIETIKVNNSPLSVSSKGVNIDLSSYALKSDVTGAMKIKGSVANYEALPSSPTTGDAYLVETADSTHNIEAGEIVLWDGDAWQDMGGTIDLSAYMTTSTANSTFALKTHTHTVSQITDAESWISGKGYETASHASSTYQPISGMSNYLTTATASSTYQTISGMSAYQTVAGMSVYAKTADFVEITATEIQGLFD